MGSPSGKQTKTLSFSPRLYFIIKMWNKAQQGESFVCDTRLVHVSLWDVTNSMFSSEYCSRTRTVKQKWNFLVKKRNLKLFYENV